LENSEADKSASFFYLKILKKFGSSSSRSTPGASEPRGILTESHPASAGLPTFVAGRQKWVGVRGEAPDMIKKNKHSYQQ
jgi:hypothetical protein